MRGAAPAMNMGQPKTQYIHGTGVESDPVAGWVVVVKGPGRGNFCPVYVGMNSVGRESSQRVGLSFGDDSISREEHAFITYDEEARSFYPHRRVSNHVLHRLHLRKGAAELFSLLAVLDAFFKRFFGDAERHARDADTTSV